MNIPYINKDDKRYLDVSIPSAIEGVFMVLLASADFILVGPLGSGAIAAVGLFSQPRMVLLSVVRSMANTVTLLVAHKVGAGERKAALALLGQSTFLCAAVMGILHLVFYYFLEQILLLMGGNYEYLEQAMTYGQLATLSVFVTTMVTILQSVQLGFGETAPIMTTNVAGNIVKIIVSALLIYGAGPLPALGIAGAAWGTVAGTIVTLLLTIYIMQVENYFSECDNIMPDRKFFKEFMPIFNSVFAEQGAERIGMVLFARMAAGLGTLPFAVHSIVMNVNDIYWCFAQGLSKGSMVLAGQAYGAKDQKSWNINKRVTLKWSIFFSTIAFAIIALFREPIFKLFSNDPETLSLGIVIMLFAAFVSYPSAHGLVYAGILRGSGKTKEVAIYSFVLITILRPAMTAFFLYVIGWGIYGLWTALVLDQCLRAACSTYYMSKIKSIA